MFSCFLWIGGISWIAVALLGFSSVAGWMIAGTLGALAITAIGILVYEVRHAIDLPDDVDLEMMDGCPEDPFSDAYPISTNLRARRASPVHLRH